ncbi:MAG: RsmE family RNA methyltransferase [Gemmatimonadaceae bacterium]
MERHDRTPVATFFSETPFVAGETVGLSEGAAHHARVKRLEIGDLIRLTDGAGHRAIGAIQALDKKAATVSIDEVETVPSLGKIHLRVPVADRDRMLWLAEKSTELGISSWQAVRFTRSLSVNPRGEGEAFREKVRARMVSALEQSGGAWLPSLLADTSVEALAATLSEKRILLDVGGEPLACIARGIADGETTIVMGPEGGFESSEQQLFVQAGWTRARLATNVLRFETAGIAAVAALRAAE